MTFSMGRILKDHGKKIMAVLGAVLMITFFLPSYGNRSRANFGAKTVATVYGNENISASERERTRDEWEILRHLGLANDTQGRPLPEAVLGPNVLAAIDSKPDTFLLLVREASHQGVSLSRDSFENTIRNNVSNFPDESSPNYDLALNAVHDLLLVSNLLNRVSDTIKFSEPRAVQMLAETEQSVSLNVVQFNAGDYHPPTSQPSDKDIQSQYDRYSQIIAGQISATNPLGFGYLLPNRVMVQYVGFTLPELLQYVKTSQPLIDREYQARRLYRTHSDEFAIPTTNPTTEPTNTVVAWEDLPQDAVNRVYDALDSKATTDLAVKIRNRVSDVLEADWTTYHDAVAKGLPAPNTAFGVAYNTDDYMHKLADSIEHDFGIRPVMGLANNTWKTAADLTALPEIGASRVSENASFALYATNVGDKFDAAQQLPVSQRLALWQPSQPTMAGSTEDPHAGGIFFFRLTGMDPSHATPLADAHDQIVNDLHQTQQWDMAIKDANDLLTQARQTGLLTAARKHVPPLSMTTTDLFDPNTAQTIVGLTLKPPSVLAVDIAAEQLISEPPPGRPNIEVPMGADRIVAVVELKETHANWQDAAQRQTLQARSVIASGLRESRLLEEAWCQYDNVAKRTQYKETPNS